MRRVDVLYDNIIADWLVRSRIDEASARAGTASASLLRLLSQLRAVHDRLREQIAALEKQRADLIATAE